MESTVRIGQMNPVTADIRGNTRRIIEAIESAEQDGVDIIVFPEMAVTGYCIRDLIEDDVFVDANLAALDRIREQTGETVAVVGYIEQNSNGTYNAAAVLQDGEQKGSARKALLPNYRYFDDERYFDPGGEASPVTVELDGEGLSLGVSICEDMWDTAYDRSPVTELAAAGADIILNLNASPFQPGKRETRHSIIQRHIETTGLPFVYANTAGVGDVEKNIIVFDGDSLVYSSEGELLAKGAQFATDTPTVTIGGSPRERGTSDGTTGEAGDLPTTRRVKELHDAIVLGIRDYVEKTGFSTLIEPVSGGIDSSVGLALCVEAVGWENVLAFNLPSRVNSETTKSIAAELTSNLGVQYHSIPVQDIYTEVIDTYESAYDEITTDTARENVYARIRALLMMLVSNDAPADDPAMLVSNGNETEMGLGYVTLYGDMASGLAILGDVSKMDVYRLGRYINERHGEAVIPEQTFEIAPSAELKADQADPFDYQTVSPVVNDLLEQRLSPAEIVAGFEAEQLDANRYGIDENGETVYDRYTPAEFEDIVYDTYQRLTRSTFKRVQSAPNIVVSERAFGTDFREPLINEWDGRPVFDDE